MYYTKLFQHNYLIHRGVGTGTAGPATAGPMFPEPTIKSIIPLFINQANLKIFMLQLHIYTILIKFALLYYQTNKIPIFLKQQLRYRLSACKNNSRLFIVKLNNKFPRRFLLISCHQVPRVHLKNLLKFKFFKFLK